MIQLFTEEARHFSVSIDLRGKGNDNSNLARLGVDVRLDKARQIAEEFVREIAEASERVQIAGSIRRNKSEVNDLDIVVIPKFRIEADDTLFGDRIRENMLEKKLADMCMDGLLVLEANGPKIKRFLKQIDGETIPINLYIATEATWWTLLLIHTGSRESNIRLARRALDLHMHLKADGSGLMTESGGIISIGSEEEIFKHLGMEFQPPEKRN